jgi:nitrite reductase/ring-hydroxylating ferredoxin subunit
VHGYWFDVTDGSVKRGTCHKAKVYRIDEKNGQATIWL